MSQKEVWIKPREFWTEEDTAETIVKFTSVEEVIEIYKGYLTEEDIVKLNQQKDGNT